MIRHRNFLFQHEIHWLFKQQVVRTGPRGSSLDSHAADAHVPVRIKLSQQKNLSSRPEIYKAFKLFLCPKYRKSGSTFFKSKAVAARSDWRRLGNVLCLCLPVRTAQAVPERGPKSSAIDFAFKTLDCLLSLELASL